MVWCGVVWCGVVWCGVVWCGVVWCGVVWCGVPKALLPQANGRDVYQQVQVNGRRCMSCARSVYACRSWRREGEPGRPGRHQLGDRPYSRSTRCTPSRSACWCRRSSCNAHAIVLPGPRRAFSSVARALAWATGTVWTPRRRGGGIPCPARGALCTPGGPAALRGSAGLLPIAPVLPVWCAVVWCGALRCGPLGCVIWCGVPCCAVE